MDLVRLSPKKFSYLANHYEVMTYYRNYFWWSRDIYLLEKTFSNWLTSWLKNKNKKNEIYQLYQNSYSNIKNILVPLKSFKPKQLNDRLLYDLYYQAKKVFLESIIFSEYTTDGFDDFFGKIFGAKINQFAKNKISENELSQLMQPAYVSQSLLYKKDLLIQSLKNINQPAAWQKMAEDFGWIMMSWDGSRQLTVRDIKSELNKLKKQSRSRRLVELKKINGFVKSVLSQRAKILGKHGLKVDDFKIYFELLDEFSKFHDWRKETQMKSNQIIFPVLREMARRFEVDYKNFLFYSNFEIKKLCLNKIKVKNNIIEKRKAGLTWVIKDGKIRETQGAEAKKVLDRLVLFVVKAKNTSAVKGIVASDGKVTGPACVAKGASEAIKMIKTGDVLITSMTTIDYLPAMRRAAAIVTDDGGVTCHASIVSRELGIPCVVGTKIATQVFKTGDQVEVDADKGMITKI